MFLQKGNDLEREVFNELIEFLKYNFYTPHYSIQNLLSMEMCRVMNDLTGGDDFHGCSEDLGQYGLNVPKALIDTVLEHFSEQNSDVDAIILDGDFIAHGHALWNASHPFEDKNETWQILK